MTFGLITRSFKKAWKSGGKDRGMALCHTPVWGDGTDCTALPCNEWRNLGKRGQIGVNTTCKKWWRIKSEITIKVINKLNVTSGGKDSGIRAEKNCFLMALSDGAEHRPYKRL